MAQTFRPFYCDVTQYVPQIPMWTNQPVSIPIVTFAVYKDGELLIVNGEVATVSSAFVSREYAGIPYEEDQF